MSILTARVVTFQTGDVGFGEENEARPSFSEIFITLISRTQNFGSCVGLQCKVVHPESQYNLGTMRSQHIMPVLESSSERANRTTEANKKNNINPAAQDLIHEKKSKPKLVQKGLIRWANFICHS
jgi:hypothetical protein